MSKKVTLMEFANAVRAVLKLKPLPIKSKEVREQRLQEPSDEERFYIEPVCWRSVHQYGQPTRCKIEY